ncbi:homing endonuclease associated repeat-containing protein (plasmid) [Halorutilales archaeon Cl-col2-1]
MTSGKQINKQDLIDDLKRVADMVEGKPKVEDIEELSKYSYSAYWARFGSLDSAREEAGITEKSNKPDFELKIKIDKIFSFSF